MKLVFSSDHSREVTVNTEFVKDGQAYIVTTISKPHKPGSTGKVYAKPIGVPNASEIGYYPSVWGMEWIEREDQGWTPDAAKPRKRLKVEATDVKECHDAILTELRNEADEWTQTHAQLVEQVQWARGRNMPKLEDSLRVAREHADTHRIRAEKMLAAVTEIITG